MSVLSSIYDIVRYPVTLAARIVELIMQREKVGTWLAKREKIDTWIANEEKIEWWLAKRGSIERWGGDNERLVEWSLANTGKLDLWVSNEALIDLWLLNKPLLADALESDRRRRLIPEFQREYKEFTALSAASDRGFTIDEADLRPCLDDRTEQTGFDRHYTYHPAWAARILAKTRPQKHVDISSILAFGTMVSAFIPVEFYDVRPAPLVLENLSVGQADLFQLPFATGSINSLSCMHVIEHIGLGRYGDPLDPDGDIKAIDELVRVLAPGGSLLVATPVGRPRIQFNAHRIYDYQAFAKLFAGLTLKEFALIPDGEASEGLLYNPAPELVAAQEYGCGCFWFQKPAAKAKKKRAS